MDLLAGCPEEGRYVDSNGEHHAGWDAAPR
jgi:hypothetical protein